ncbi:MAG: AEC family transporter [Lachnospiraceae bacterium]|nr:AEC family transporter [Lachnospiraceae bacterium]
MLDSFIVVGTQVAVLFIMIALGFFGGKRKIITGDGVKCINDIMLYFVTPCVIIHAFQRDYNSEMLKNLLLSMLAALISHIVCYVLAYAFIRNKEESKKKVLRFAVIFSNCGFMALPLLEALLGSEGVFYGAGYLTVFYLIVWSLGQYSMAKGTSGFKMYKAVLNPGVLSVIIGLILFFTSFTLPEIIGSPIAFLSGLNTPVPMLIIGYAISNLDLRDIINIKAEAGVLLLRLIVAPLITLGILYALNYRGNLLIASIVSAATPVAAITTMFSIKFGGDEKLASKIVAVSSLFSILTMTFIVAFARYIA